MCPCLGSSIIGSWLSQMEKAFLQRLSRLYWSMIATNLTKMTTTKKWRTFIAKIQPSKKSKPAINTFWTVPKISSRTHKTSEIWCGESSQRSLTRDQSPQSPVLSKKHLNGLYRSKTIGPLYPRAIRVTECNLYSTVRIAKNKNFWRSMSVMLKKRKKLNKTIIREITMIMSIITGCVPTLFWRLRPFVILMLLRQVSEIISKLCSLEPSLMSQRKYEHLTRIETFKYYNAD